jgi:sRNA-binding regulator protein Hfq
MGLRAYLPGIRNVSSFTVDGFDPMARRGAPGSLSVHLNGQRDGEDTGQRQAELFYLQKQIQSQTPMVIVLEDGEHIEGMIEWYDRNSLKVRGRTKSLVYKSAIKYMYKLGDAGTQ